MILPSASVMLQSLQIGVLSELVQPPRETPWPHLVENILCLLQGQTFEAPINAGGAREGGMQDEAVADAYCQAFVTLIQPYQH